LRLPPDTTSAEIEKRIDAVLEEVEMIAQKEQVINSLSGGQRKRVSIASELLAEPRLFFLDEPTSGLDPGLEKKMMYTLRRMADAGRTIILVTHATANISQCDHVCFLSQGRMMYYGPPGESFDFFGVRSDDFSDIYDELDSSGLPKDLTSLLAKTKLTFKVLDQLKLIPSFQGVFDLYENQEKMQATYTCGLSVESRLERGLRFGGRYKGILRYPLGEQSTVTERFNNEFGVGSFLQFCFRGDTLEGRVTIGFGQGAFLDLAVHVLADDGECLLELWLCDIDERHLPSTLGKDVSDAVSHRTSANYCHLFHYMIPQCCH